MTWVLRQSEAKLGARLVLLALADYAHADGSEAYPAVDTLAAHTRLSRRAVQSALRTLEGDGEIVRDGVGRNGTTCWRLTMGAQNPHPPAGGEDDDPGGRSSRHAGGEAASPNPSKATVRDSSKENSAREDEFPEDLPESMHETAIAVGKILRRTAQTRGQKKAVTRAAVGHAVLSFDDRPHLQVAREVEHWLLHGKGARKSCADIVSRYRNFLANSEPAAGPPLPAGVAPLHGRRLSNADQVEANIQRLREMGRLAGGAG